MIEFEYQDKMRIIDRDENPDAYEAICNMLELDPDEVYGSFIVKMKVGYYYNTDEVIVGEQSAVTS